MLKEDLTNLFKNSEVYCEFHYINMVVICLNPKGHLHAISDHVINMTEVLGYLIL